MSARNLPKLGCFALLLLCGARLIVGQASAIQGTPVAWGGGALGATNVPANLTNVIAVAAGYHFGLAVKADGTVVGWGDSSAGKTTPPVGLNGVVAVAAGYNHAIALKNNGTVVAWGDNSSGQLDVPAWVVGIKAIAAGHYHNLALASNGAVYAWGANGYGQATVPAIYYPVTAIAAGGNHSLALLNTGQVAGWGHNIYGQIYVSDLYSISGLAAGDTFSLFIQGGTVFGRGNNSSGQLTPPPGLAGVIAVAAGGSHSVALKSDHTLAVWGDNTSGQLNMPAGIAAAFAISAGATHTVVQKVDPVSIITQPLAQTVVSGSSVTFSLSARGSPPLFYLWYKDATAISGATNASYTINPVQAGHAGVYWAYVWNGLNFVASDGARLTVNTIPSITSQPQDRDVGVGGSTSFSVTATGTAPLYYQWRLEGANLPGANSATYAITNARVSQAGNYRVVVANTHGAVTSQVAVLTVRPIPVIVRQPQSQNVLAGSSATMGVEATDVTTYQWRKDGAALAGANSATYSISSVHASNVGYYSVALTNAYGGLISATAMLSVITLPPGSNGLLVAWGERWVWNGSSYVDLAPPGGLANVLAIASGLCHSLALINGGSVIGWGDNSFGQAGPPTSLANVIEIAAGNYHSLARRVDQTVEAWGKNDFGQATVPSSLGNVIAIAAGAHHSLALKSDGTIVGWGNSIHGQTVPPPDVGNVNFKSIAAGQYHSLGVRFNWTVAAWGLNDLNQTRVPLGLEGVAAVAAGNSHSLALRTNGTVVAWGDNSYGQTNVPRGLANVIAIACGANHCLALKRGGAVVSWGQNNFGQAETPPGLAGVLAVAARGDHSLVLKRLVLRLQEIHRLANGTARLLLRNEDDSDVTPEKFSKVEIRASPNFGLNITNWFLLTNNVWLINGSIQVEDPSTNLLRRFYMSVERP